MLARHGYGVLALDNPGNGESEGHSNGFGDNAQAGLDAGLDYLARRPDVDPSRIAGFGVSLGGEVLLEAAARDRRLAAVVSDGAARVGRLSERHREHGRARPRGDLARRAVEVRAISGMEPSRPLVGMHARRSRRARCCWSRPARIPESSRQVSRMYQRAGGDNVRTCGSAPGAGHTGGLRKHPAEYERRTVGFLDEALSTR